MSEIFLNMRLAETDFSKGLRVQLYEVSDIPDEGASTIITNLSESMRFKLRKYYTAPHRSSDRLFIAVGSSDDMPSTLELEMFGVAYTATKVNPSYILNPRNISDRRTLGKLLNNFLRNQYGYYLRRDLWQRSKSGRTYCRIKPEIVVDGLEVYRGFKFRVEVFPDGRIGQTVDPVTTIVDSKSLYQRIREEGIEEASERYLPRYMALDQQNGTRRTVYVERIERERDVTEKSFKNFRQELVSAYDAFGPFNPRTAIEVSKDEPNIICKYHQDMDDYFCAPPSCLFSYYPNWELEDHPDAKKHLIIDTSERIRLSTEFHKIMTTAYAGKFGDPDYEVKFGLRLSEPNDFEGGQIPLPTLVFGDGQKLSVRDLESRDKWNIIKQLGLSNFGPFRTANIDSILVISPKSSGELVSGFYEDVKKASEKWKQPLPEKYEVIETEEYLGVLDRVEKYQHEFDAAIVVFKEFDQEKYARVKGALEIPSQGVVQSTILQKEVLRKRGREFVFDDTLGNIVSGLIGKAGAVPWILGDALSSDCYIGVDSGGPREKMWSYAYVFDQYGEYVGAERGRATETDNIMRSRFKDSIVRVVKRKCKLGDSPRSVVVHRDGEITRQEMMAFQDALDELSNDGLIDEGTGAFAVDLKKSNPYRIYEREDGLKDGFIGSYFLLDEDRAVLNTTGRPVLTQGTANSLLIEVKRLQGEANIKDTVRDIFYLSELNWGSPKRDVKLPITVRFAEKTAYQASLGIDYPGLHPL